MADLKISQLNAITVLTPATDVLPVVDSGGVTKKITTNQILGSGGTATLASATITGDLTVDTSTLKVDATNNRVGILTASPAYALDVAGAGNFQQLRVSNSGATNIGLVNTTSGLTYSLYSANSASNGFDGFGILDGTSYVLRINTNGALVLTGGTVGASGVGIAFPATQVASSDANCLDDYEEGTWTGTLTFSTTPQTSTNTFTGRYTKVGRIVSVQGYLLIGLGGFVKGSASGTLTITGLPFTSGVALTQYQDLAASIADISSGSLCFASVSTGGTAFSFESMSVSGAVVQRNFAGITAANFAATNAGFIGLQLNITYTV